MKNTDKNIENKEIKKNAENKAQDAALSKEELEKVAGGGMGRPAFGDLNAAFAGRKR